MCTRDRGDDGFRQVENRINADLAVKHSVIATGGSVIYGREAMQHLKKIGVVIYLKLSCESIAARLGDLRKRGITLREGQTLQQLSLIHIFARSCPDGASARMNAPLPVTVQEAESGR